MKHFRNHTHRLGRLAVVSVSILVPWWSGMAATGPDRIIFKNGREATGLIVRSDSASITLEEGNRTRRYEREIIRRIDDTATTGAYFAASAQALPPWKALVNDLRSNETIRRLECVESGREASGPFADVPYTAFLLNGSIDVHVYGDPQNPAGILIGLRGGKAGSMAERKSLRAFFAGFLTDRSQIAALYRVDLQGGEANASGMQISIGRHPIDKAGDGWWLATWQPSRVAEWKGRPNLVTEAGWDEGFTRDRDGTIQLLRNDRNAFASRD